MNDPTKKLWAELALRREVAKTGGLGPYDDPQWHEDSLRTLREDIHKLHISDDPYRIHRTMSGVTALLRRFDRLCATEFDELDGIDDE